jgi:L-lactate dehydrogenase
MPTQDPVRKSRKIVIICSDQISAADVYSLIQGRHIDEITLIGDPSGRVVKELNELRQLVPLQHDVAIRAGTYADVENASVIIYADSRPPEPDETPAMTLERNIVAAREAGAALRSTGFVGVAVVTVSPVDILARIFLEASGLPERQVIGIGTGFLDIGLDRPATESVEPDVQSQTHFSAENIGSSIWCTAAVRNISFMDSCNAECPRFESILGHSGITSCRRVEDPKREPGELAACVSQLCRAVIEDARTVVPVYARSVNSSGPDVQFEEMLCIIGSKGIESMIKFPSPDPRNESSIVTSAW